MHLKICLFLLLSVLYYNSSPAQVPVVFKGQPDLKGPINIIPHTLFYEDISGDTLPFAQIKTKHFIPLAKTFTVLQTAERPLIVNWLKFRVQNTNRTDTLNLVFSCNTHVYTSLYSYERPSGQHFSFEQPATDKNGMQLIVLPGRTNTYYVRVIEYIHNLMPLNAELHTPLTHLQNYQMLTTASNYLFMVMCMALGFLLFMFIYAGYQFLLSRERSVAYYAAYVGCAIYVWLIIIDQRFSLEIFDPLGWSFHTPISSGIVFFYALFIARMLNVAVKQPKKWRVLQALLILIILETLVEVWSNYLGHFIFSTNAYYLYVQQFPNLLVNIYLIYLIIISKEPIKKYLLTGLLSLFFLLIVVTNLSFYVFVNVDSLKLKMFANFPPIFGMLGVVTEAVCFAFALIYRGKLIQEERNQLQSNYTGHLENELKQRTLQIQQHADLLESQKIQQLETVFEKRLAETEMTALRAQMNPHFIFNCLNSIKLYTLENDSETASAYLTTFSRLIRLVLENSRSEKVTLENELETLRLYMELEVMRFKEKVRFEISVADEIDTPYIEVPPLLLQPYVENAIWHGLMHKETGGNVRINVTQPEDQLLLVEITDDGVGREQAALYKSKSIIKHKSFGLKMTGERIQIINQLYNTQTAITIVDLKDGNGNACGTQVNIYIPI